MEKLKQFDDFLDDEREGFSSNSREWVKLDESIKNEGFRIGKEKNQEEFLQKGFNAGFKDGITLSIAGGKLQGRLCAYLTLLSEHDISSKAQGGTEQHVSISEKSSSTSLAEKLLSSTTGLIAQIPNILSNDRSQDIPHPTEGISCLHEDTSTQKCCSVQNTNSSSVDEMKLGCSALDPVHTTNKDTKENLSCQDVCLSKANFWSQLENFRLQATAAGVLLNE
ncbi:unnamed protein product [Lymnaea stagnalis]|uniref:Essential protein Yae1 N-terminal domain-containing protein n=1 Tax=Lymnaea stagnalis TaxID=6523 RepID=A0AAV2I2A6_LYMST